MFGISASSTDVFNYNTSAAEARAKDEQTKTDAERAAVDLELYRQQSLLELEQMQITKEKQKKQAEIEPAQIQDNYQLAAEQRRIRAQQQLEMERLVRLSILGVLVLGAVVRIFGLGYYFLGRG